MEPMDKTSSVIVDRDSEIMRLRERLQWIAGRCPKVVAEIGLDEPHRIHAEAMYDAGECARAALNNGP